MKLDIDAAIIELRDKTILDIERATALTWGGRAAASFRLASETDGDERAHWLMDGENYRQESLEHAAMTEDIAFLEQLRIAVDADRPVRRGAP